MESIIISQLQEQRNYFNKGITKKLPERIDALKRLQASVKRHTEDIASALWEDLHKSAYEAYLTETGMVLRELKMLISNLKNWMRTENVCSPVFLFPSKSKIVKEPYGHTLILGPWNYPFQLIMIPLASAIAAGNVVALKPSADAPKTAEIINKIVSEVFDKGHARCFHGELEVSEFLLSQRFDYIFFTGSPRVGKIVMAAAANYLTPVTLELGGKSPCIVDETADIKTAARRIIWGKLVNAGQTCIAPDYLLVHKNVKKELLEHMVGYIKQFYGENPQESVDYARIVSAAALDRLVNLIKGEGIYFGGISDRESRYLSPTILNNVSDKSPIMQEEIFGPILPVLAVDNIEDAISYVQQHEKPLALYYFGNPEKGKMVINQTSSGGACINDTILHIANSKLPFGGVGQSGMGSYHGRAGFETFTHRRSVIISRNRIDFSIKFPPYKNLSLLKWLLG